MSYDIVFITTSSTQSVAVQGVLDELGLDCPIFEAYCNEAVPIAKWCIQDKGARVIVSRGGTALFLRQNLEIPVVDIRHSFLDIHLSMQAAFRRASRIAVVGYHSLCRTADDYRRAMGVELTIREMDGYTDVESYSRILRELKEEGVELVVGGFPVAFAAKKHGVQYMAEHNDPMSIRWAAVEALHNLKVEEKRLEERCSYEAVLDNSSEGIIQVDPNGMILRISSFGASFLRMTAGGSVIGLIPDQIAHRVLLEGKGVYGLRLNLRENPVVLSCIPTRVGERIAGAVFTFRPEYPAFPHEKKAVPKTKDNGLAAKKRFRDIVGCTPVMTGLIETAKRFALADSTVLIYGETGTGKEIFAQSIHNYSRRRHRAFLAVNCAAIPDALLESELFGYAPGAFTGARREGKPGVFELAEGGTVFLDEIAEFPMNVQAKLLRVLQEREIFLVGDSKVTPVDVRIVAASNKDLLKEVRAGRFREDLYYRLSILELRLPPLRERKDDIALLAQKFIADHDKSGTRRLTLEAAEYLCGLNYPGNIRELQNLLERVLVMEDGQTVTRAAVERIAGGGGEPEAPPEGPLKNALLAAEEEAIRRALREAGGRRRAAAGLLGVSPTTLWRRMKRMGLSGEG